MSRWFYAGKGKRTREDEDFGQGWDMMYEMIAIAMTCRNRSAQCTRTSFPLLEAQRAGEMNL